MPLPTLSAALKTEDGTGASGILMACVMTWRGEQDPCRVPKDLVSGTGCQRGGAGGNLTSDACAAARGAGA